MGTALLATHTHTQKKSLYSNLFNCNGVRSAWRCTIMDERIATISGNIALEMSFPAKQTCKYLIFHHNTISTYLLLCHRKKQRHPCHGILTHDTSASYFKCTAAIHRIIIIALLLLPWLWGSWALTSH